jgi:riboflavin biosynthesis pyrimidine reductase
MMKIMTSLSAGEERFGRLVEAKTRRAIAASLPPYVTEFERADAAARAIGNAWSMRIFDGRFYLSPPRSRNRPACSLVFVQSADGNTGAANPGTLGGGETDKHVVYEGLSRVAADAVLAGAGTIRGTDVVFSVWHPELVGLRAALGLPRHPVQIVATVRGVDLDQSLLFNVPELPVAVVTVDSGLQQMREGLSARPWIRPVLMKTASDLAGAFDQLAAMGIRVLSCIGGRTLGANLLDAGLVDDVYLTTAAKPGGPPGTPIHPADWRDRPVVRKRGTAEEAGVVFEHLIPRVTA